MINAVRVRLANTHADRFERLCHETRVLGILEFSPKRFWVESLGVGPVGRFVTESTAGGDDFHHWHPVHFKFVNKEPDLLVPNRFPGVRVEVLGPPSTLLILVLTEQADPNGTIGVMAVRSLAALRWNVIAETPASSLAI